MTYLKNSKKTVNCKVIGAILKIINIYTLYKYNIICFKVIFQTFLYCNPLRICLLHNVEVKWNANDNPVNFKVYLCAKY